MRPHMLSAGAIFLKTNNQVHVEQEVISRDLYYDQIVLLSYTIQYPQFSSESFQPAVQCINQFYREKVIAYQLYFETKLFRQAMEQYQNAIENKYPVMKFEAFVVYTVTYNENCTISVYCDSYEFTGGAHGNTLRFSETWNLNCGKQTKLCELFASPNYKCDIIKMINCQIAEQIKNGTNQYFENYSELVAQNFNEDNFYLTPQGVVIYFQEYDIAPHSSGLPTFLLPFSAGCAIRPCCR